MAVLTPVEKQQIHGDLMDLIDLLNDLDAKVQAGSPTTVLGAALETGRQVTSVLIGLGFKAGT